MFGGCVENNFRAVEVTVDGFDGVFHDVLNAKSCSHVKDNVGFCDEFVYKGFIADIAGVDRDLSFEMSDVGLRAGAQVVEDSDGISAGDEGICQVRTDESGTTGNESVHEVSLSLFTRTTLCYPVRALLSLGRQSRPLDATERYEQILPLQASFQNFPYLTKLSPKEALQQITLPCPCIP